VPRSVLLPWERRLWRGRSALAPWARHYITDFRLVSDRAGTTVEIALHDIADVRRSRTPADRLLGTSTLTIIAHDRRRAPLVLARIRRGEQAAALLALLTDAAAGPVDAAALQTALSWSPQSSRSTLLEALVSLLIIVTAAAAVVVGRHRASAVVRYAADDAIAPNGVQRDRAEIVRFMEADVMPWARDTLGQITGGAGRVTCATCHGRDGESRGWKMPAVAALPAPDVKGTGWEQYSGGMDAQMRNAIYGYIAESTKQKRATFMREVVMPGMARLLHRPPYDFTQSYEYNRAQNAFGCYHCHRVK